MTTAFKNSFDLSGKVAVIIGAGGGIGPVLSLGLAEYGADVVLADINSEYIASLENVVKKTNKKYFTKIVDVRNLDQINELKDETIKKFGKVDILLNNFGLNFNEYATDVTEEHWDKIIDVNLKGVFFSCQTFGKEMIKQKKGKIINTSSTFGLVGYEKRSAYCASKGGVSQITKVLAIEWAPFNINVNAIAPTATHTPMNEALFSDSKWREEVLRRIPMGKFCTPQDLLGAVIFLASEASNLVTGITLPVDGGWTSW
ncbi:MAG: SDR family NAD(P)-dependent oxidoreductase [Candidatus Humimicrobiaceae bacterium]